MSPQARLHSLPCSEASPTLSPLHFEPGYFGLAKGGDKRRRISEVKLLSNLNKVNPIQVWESFGSPNGECQADLDASARLPTRHISPLTLLARPLSTSHYLTHCVYFICSRLLLVTERQLREGKDFVCCCSLECP